MSLQCEGSALKGYINSVNKITVQWLKIATVHATFWEL